jgi:hypothetical protein
MLTKDAAVFAGVCVMGIFALGLEIGKQHQPMLCPVVPGQQIVSTVAPDVCVYASSYGRALRKVKAVKS